jgi:hypothetical protein
MKIDPPKICNIREIDSPHNASNPHISFQNYKLPGARDYLYVNFSFLKLGTKYIYNCLGKHESYIFQYPKDNKNSRILTVGDWGLNKVDDDFEFPDGSKRYGTGTMEKIQSLINDPNNIYSVFLFLGDMAYNLNNLYLGGESRFPHYQIDDGNEGDKFLTKLTGISRVLAFMVL